MERLQIVAFQTVGRAVSFAGLGIVCIMLSFAFDPVLALQSGGLLILLVLAVLLLKAHLALKADHRRTEIWLYLGKHERPHESIAQWAISTVLRETYFWFARLMAKIAVALWGLAAIMPLLGISRVAVFGS